MLSFFRKKSEGDPAEETGGIAVFTVSGRGQGHTGLSLPDAVRTCGLDPLPISRTLSPASSKNPEPVFVLGVPEDAWLLASYEQALVFVRDFASGGWVPLSIPDARQDLGCFVRSAEG